MLSGTWIKGTLCLTACLFFGSAFAQNDFAASRLDGTSTEASGNETIGAPLACAISEGRWGGGPPMDLKYWSGVGEELLLVGAGAELIVYDIDTPTAPAELGRALLNQMAYSEYRMH